MYNRETQMLIYMINTYTDAVYGATGDYDTIKADIMSATGMDEGFFESIKDELGFVSFAKDEEFVYDTTAPVTPAASSPQPPLLNNYDEAVAHLCEALNKRDDEMDLDDTFEARKLEDFIPMFKSTNYFGIYHYNAVTGNEYYLVDRTTGGHAMVLGDSFEFIGTNLLDCMQDEKVLNVANKEFLHYLVHFSLENAKGILPVKTLSGIAVLERALRKENEKAGAYYPNPPLADQIKAAVNRTAAPESSSQSKDCRHL